MNFFRKVFIASVCLIVSLNLVAASSLNIAPVKVVAADKELARKIAISFHHAVLESHIEENYLILDLNERDLKKLNGFDIKITPAEQWLQKVESQLAELKALQQNASHKNPLADHKATQFALAGIPGYECYQTVEETFTEGERLAQEYPQLASWIDIGDSWSKINAAAGYDLMVLKITNQEIVKDKPKLFIHSAMHAREYTPAALTLDFAKQLIESYATNPDYQWIVDHHEVHILFHMNPDGRKIAEGQILQRKNTNAAHCPGGHVGVDLNRNFAHTWNSTQDGSSGNACDGDYRGNSAESEPETQAVSNYIRSLFPDRRGPNDDDPAPDDTQGMHLDIHSYSQLVLWPYGHKTGVSPNDDAFVEMGNKLAWFNGYTPMQSVGLYPTDGTSDDVSYGELGIPAITFELGTEFFQNCATYRLSIKQDNLAALTYAAKIVSAPYLIPFGPDISSIQLNSSNQSTTVSAGASVELNVAASATRTGLSGGERNIQTIEYSIDTPIWDPSANPVVIFDNQNANPPTNQNAQAVINTDTLAIGSHLVYIRATNSQGQAGAVSAGLIIIGTNNSPTALFDFNCTDLVCNFDATASSDSDGSIDNFLWDFGDGNQSEGVTVTHTFASAGSRDITLSITDNSGNLATSVQSVTVEQPVTPEPEPSGSSSGGGGLPWSFIVSMFMFSVFMRRRKQEVKA